MIDPAKILAIAASLRPTTRAPNPASWGSIAKGEGTSRFLSTLMGLDPRTQRPGLSNNPAMMQGIQQAGMALLAAPKPQKGQLLLNIGQALGYGQQVAQSAQMQSDQMQALESLNLPPAMRALLQTLPPAERGQAAFSMLSQQKPAGSTVLPSGARLVNDQTGETLAENPVAEKNGFKVFANGGVWDDNAGEWLVEPPAQTPQVVVNTGSRASAVDEALATQAADVVGKQFESTAARLPNVAAIDRALEITNESDFPSGPGVVIKDVLDNWSNPQAVALRTEFDQITGQIMLDILQNFPGQLSEKELETARALSGGKRDIPVEAVRAALQAIRRVAVRNAVMWAGRMRRLGASPEFAGKDLSEQLNLAEQIIQKHDPLGLR